MFGKKGPEQTPPPEPKITLDQIVTASLIEKYRLGMCQTIRLYDLPDMTAKGRPVIFQANQDRKTVTMKDGWDLDQNFKAEELFKSVLASDKESGMFGRTQISLMLKREGSPDSRIVIKIDPVEAKELLIVCGKAIGENEQWVISSLKLFESNRAKIGPKYADLFKDSAASILFDLFEPKGQGRSYTAEPTKQAPPPIDSRLAQKDAEIARLRAQLAAANRASQERQRPVNKTKEEQAAETLGFDLSDLRAMTPDERRILFKNEMDSNNKLYHPDVHMQASEPMKRLAEKRIGIVNGAVDTLKRYRW